MIVPIIFAVILSNLVTPFLYRSAPNDFARTQLILKTIKNKKLHPDVVLFGSSILMSGINARQLSDSLNNIKIYNFSSTGQTIKESMLYYPDLPKSTKTVVQFMQTDEFQRDPDVYELKEPIMRNFLMFGYKPREDLNKLLAPSETEYFDAPKYLVDYQARTIMVTAFNRSVRQFLRPDLQLDKANKELYFPNVYTKPLSPNEYGSRIAQENPAHPINSITINSKMMALLLKGRDYLKSKGINLIIVVYPLNADLYNYTDSYRKDFEVKIKQVNALIPVVSCADALLGTKGSFVDHEHVSRPGAKVLTGYLAVKLKKEVPEYFDNKF